MAPQEPGYSSPFSPPKTEPPRHPYHLEHQPEKRSCRFKHIDIRLVKEATGDGFAPRHL